MNPRRLLLLILLAATAAVAQDDERVLLRYQWTAGEEIAWTVISETTGTVLMRDLTKDPVEETEMPIWTRVTTPMTLQVEAVDESGNGTIAYETGIMEIDNEVEGQQQYMRVDTRAGTMIVDGEEMPLPPGVASGMGGPFRMVISPRGEVLEVDLPEEMEDMMAAMGADMTQWMRMSHQWQASFPGRAVGIGHVWGAAVPDPMTLEAEVDDGVTDPGDDANMLYRLTEIRRVGEVDRARIEMLGVMDFATIPSPGAGMTAAMGDIEATIGPLHMSFSGTFDFDVSAGRVLGSEATVIMDMEQRVRGTVETPEGEQAMNMEIITRDMTVKVTVQPTQ